MEFSVSDERFYLKQKKDALSGKPVWGLYLRSGSNFEFGWDGFVALVVMVDYTGTMATITAPLVFTLVVFAEEASRDVDNFVSDVGDVIVQIPFGNALLTFLHVNGLESSLVAGLGGDHGKLDFTPESQADPIDYVKMDLGTLLDNLLNSDAASLQEIQNLGNEDIGLKINLPKTLILENGEQIFYFRDLPSETFSATLAQDVEIEIIVLARGGEVFLLNEGEEIPFYQEGDLAGENIGDDDRQLLPEGAAVVTSGLLTSLEEVLDFFNRLVFVHVPSEEPVLSDLEISVHHENIEISTARINFEYPESRPLENDADNYDVEESTLVINEDPTEQANAQASGVFDEEPQEDLSGLLNSQGADIL